MMKNIGNANGPRVNGLSSMVWKTEMLKLFDYGNKTPTNLHSAHYIPSHPTLETNEHNAIWGFIMAYNMTAVQNNYVKAASSFRRNNSLMSV